MAKTRTRKTALTFPSFDTGRKSGERWFSRNGFVLRSGGKVEVLVGGSLVASYDEGDSASRNLALVLLSQDPTISFTKLAKAFGISVETLRLIRNLHDEKGLEAVLARSRGGSSSKVTPSARRRLEKLFAQGISVSEAHSRLGRRLGFSRSTVGNIRKSWAEAQEQRPAPPEQKSLPIEAEPGGGAEPSQSESKAVVDKGESSGEIRAPRQTSDRRAQLEVPVGSPEEEVGAEAELFGRLPRGTRAIPHVGSWLMIAMLHALGLYERAEQLRHDDLDRGRLRMALDAAAIALTIGGKCIEAIRRVASTGGAWLLLSNQSPSASWVRRILGSFCRESSVAKTLHFGFAGELIRRASLASVQQEPTVFYIDNHHRPYTGKLMLRKGWRMQDRRARPGVSDYYVHDDRGSPLVRFTAPSHGSLSQILSLIAASLRLALGKTEPFLIAFDRAGAFPAPMGNLKNAGVQFATWEREPYPKPSKKRVRTKGEKVVLRGETFHVLDNRANLGNGRGRLRRVVVLTPENRLVSILAQSDQSAEWLASVMFARWKQENGFKHGVERWGINQLDGRTAIAYGPDTVIPNPDRKRLERNLRILRVREGELRRKLAHAKPGSDTATSCSDELAEVLANERELEGLRPSLPEKVALRETELFGKLVYHAPDYKMLIDTVRIGCANAESELASLLVPLLSRPREAKRAIRNLLSANGSVRATPSTITVVLDPPGTRCERKAFGQILRSLDRRRLVHPGDPLRRPMRFRIQVA